MNPIHIIIHVQLMQFSTFVQGSGIFRKTSYEQKHLLSLSLCALGQYFAFVFCFCFVFKRTNLLEPLENTLAIKEPKGHRGRGVILSVQQIILYVMCYIVHTFTYVPEQMDLISIPTAQLSLNNLELSQNSGSLKSDYEFKTWLS